MTRRIFAGILTFVLLASFTFAGGGGGGKGGGGGSGGGGNGTQPAPNPFVGAWMLGHSDFFTFKKDYTFTLILADPITGVITASYAGTYDSSLVAPDGYPVLTMISDGEILLQMESLFYEGALILERGDWPFMELGKVPNAN